MQPTTFIIDAEDDGFGEEQLAANSSPVLARLGLVATLAIVVGCLCILAFSSGSSSSMLLSPRSILPRPEATNEIATPMSQSSMGFSTAADSDALTDAAAGRK